MRPPNRAPVAADDSFDMRAGTTLAGRNVLDNDNDIDADGDGADGHDGSLAAERGPRARR